MELLLERPVTSGADLDELVGELVALGGAIAPDLFDALASGHVGEDERELGGPQRAAVLATLERLPFSSVRPALDAASEGRDLHSRAVALRVAASHAQHADLSLPYALARVGEGTVPELRDGLGYFLRTYLRRERGAAAALGPQADGAPDELFATTVAEVCLALERRSLDWLEARLGVTPERDSLVLRSIARILRTPGPRPSASQREQFVQYLASGDATLFALAAQIVTTTDDTAAIEALIERLSWRDTMLTPVAHGALVRLTGERLGKDATAWSAWWAREARWFQAGSSSSFLELATAPRAEVARVLNEVSRHRAWRHELVPHVAPVLARDELELRVLAAATIGHLRSSDAVPFLVPYLEDADESVRVAVRDALRRCVGRDLGPSPEDWSPWIPN